MSKFWGANARDSDSDSDNEEKAEVSTKIPVANKFGANYDSDSESEDEVRVVKSQTDRALDSIRERVVKIRNHQKNNDWSSIQDEFDEVNRMIDRSKMMIIKIGLPKFYVKMLAEVEDKLNATLKDREAMRKFKQTVVHAVNRMKLNVRKHNKKYETEINDFRAHPEMYDTEEEAESESDSDEESDEDEDSDEEEEEESDDESLKAPARKVVTSKEMDSDSDVSFVGSSDDEDSSSEEDEQLPGRAKWLKKVVPAKVAKPFPEDKPVAAKQVSKAAPKADAKKPADHGKKTWSAEMDMKEDVLDKKLAEIVASRGRKSTEPKEVLRKLEVLSKASRRYGAKKEIPVLMHLISAMYDSNRSIDDYMELLQWRTCCRCLLRITQLLEASPRIVLGLMPIDDVNEGVLGSGLRMKKTDDEEVEVKKEEKGPLKVVGSLETFIARLEDEYTKSLQQINPHTQDYVVRLSDEAALVELAEAVQTYYLRVGDDRAAAVVSLLHVEHTYYKHDTIAVAVQRAHQFTKVWGRYPDLHPACLGRSAGVEKHAQDVTHVHPASFMGNPSVETPVLNTSAKLDSLCQLIFKHGDERAKTRALLCFVYHHALHDRYYRARDLFLMSHIQDNIEKADTRTQILYNRAMVTMGLAAFRLGLIQKAFDSLAGICSGRVKELLAQGQGRWMDRDAEQEKVERRRQIPYHMHINPDLLECCHMICAMILELPHLTHPTSSSTQVISKTFRKYMYAYDRQVFTGPPENTREHVLAATKCLLAGEWQQACDYILKLEVWNLIPGDGGVAVKASLQERLKEEAVRTYVLTSGCHYESLSLSFLCSMFSMEAAHIKRIISRMIFNKEISAAWEQTDILVLYSSESSTLQVLALQVADKVAQLVESNERVLDPLVNFYNYKDDWSRNVDSKNKLPWLGVGDGERKRTNNGYKVSSRPNLIRQNVKSNRTTVQRTVQPKVWGKINTSNRPTQQQQDQSSKSQPPSAAQEVPRRIGWAVEL